MQDLGGRQGGGERTKVGKSAFNESQSTIVHARMLLNPTLVGILINDYIG